MTKPKIIFGLLIILGLAVSSSSAQEFTLTTTNANIVSAKASIDMPGLAGNPLAIIVATPLGDTEKLNPHPIGAWYYNDKWNIFNTDFAVMIPGLRYKVQYFLKPGSNQFLHVVTKENIGAEGSYIDSLVLNNNPNAQVKIFQNHAPDNRAFNLNAGEAKAGYDAGAGKWFITNVSGRHLYPNTAYNVVVLPTEADGSSAATPQAPAPIPTRTREPMTPSVTPIPPRTREPITSPMTQPLTATATTPCTAESAYLTPGKWGRQKQDDLAMADSTFPKAQYKMVLAKAQTVVSLLMAANPEFKGIQAFAKRGIRGESYFPGGALPYRVEAAYDAYICVGNDTYRVEKRGTVLLNGNAHPVTVYFNSLGNLIENVIDGEGFHTAGGDAVYESPKQIGELRGFTLFRSPNRRDANSEAVIIAPANRSPIKPLTREQFIKTRLKNYEDKGAGSFASEIAYLKASIANMTAAELQSQAIVSNVFAVPGKEKLFTTESAGGKPLATLDKNYFDPKLPRDAIQLIVVSWSWDDKHPSRAAMMQQFKRDFDFEALRQMLGK